MVGFDTTKQDTVVSRFGTFSIRGGGGGGNLLRRKMLKIFLFSCGPYIVGKNEKKLIL